MKLKLLQPQSIQQNITLWTGLCLLLVALISIGYSAASSRTQALADAQAQALARTQAEAAKVKAQIDAAFDACRALNQALKAVKDKNMPLLLGRDGVNAILRKTLEENPQFLGVYTLWEPNEFDGMDAQYVNTKGHDKTGRFIPYWRRNGRGGLVHDPALDYEAEGAGDWYLLPKRTQKESLIGPLPSRGEGQPVLMTSQVIPLLVDGRFRGVTGIDLKLDELVDKINLYQGAGQLLLLNNQGVIIGMTGRPEVAGKTFKEAAAELAQTNKPNAAGQQAALQALGADLTAIRAGREKVEFADDYLKVLVPVTVGQTDTPWAACLLLPLDRITAAANAQLLRQVVLGLVLIALALALLWYLAGRLALPIKAAAKFAEQVADGQQVQKISAASTDETGQLIQALNSMLESNSSLLQSREDREQMENSIMRLLEQVSSVAEGDLTREAEVAADATGAIADSFNFMIAELRRIIGKVQVVAHEVSTSAATTQHSTQQLAEGAVSQAQQIIQTSHSLDTMAHSIRRISETAGASRDVAEKSLHAAKRGAEVVQNTINGLASLREQVQETSKRIKRLGENSQEIGEIVQLISDIAYRTSVLALNASIQAARAGDAGRGFAVVAEEVQRLSKRSTEATKRITELVKTSKSGTNEAIAAMEESTRGVVEGTNLIYEAGDALAEIELVSQQLAELVQAISQTTEQQAQDSEAVVQQMVAISQATQETASGIRQSASSVNQLAALADDLQVSVASFKLSSQPTNGHVNGRYAETRYAVN